MRVVRGLEAAREWAADRFDLSAIAPPAEVDQRTEAAFGRPMTPSEVVAYIVREVRQRGDEALRQLARVLDGRDLQELEVPQQELARAREKAPASLIASLETAAARVGEFAAASLPRSWMDHQKGLGEMVVPLDRVGLYAPGGTASYPSTVIMVAVTARVAGVGERVLCTPARDAAMLAAAKIAGIQRVFQVGGAQAIAAMAFGTESVPRVDKVCGPGNIFVNLAKQQLSGQVGIDGLYGPTETVVVADDSATPDLCAADLLAQAEHDALALPVLITTSPRLADHVAEEMERQVQSLERREVIEASLKGQGAMVLVDDLEEALEVANLLAPEHLCLHVRDPWAWAGKVRNAGGLFLGNFSAEVMGDYVAGPSHVLPTHGTARFASYLGVEHFLKRIPVMALGAEQTRELAPLAAILARAEGLEAHARAAETRLGGRR